MDLDRRGGRKFKEGQSVAPNYTYPWVEKQSTVTQTAKARGWETERRAKWLKSKQVLYDSNRVGSLS